MDRLLFVLLIIAGALWLYDDAQDAERISALENQVAAAEVKVMLLEGELATAKSDFTTAISAVEAANAAINSILDKAGRDIDEGLKGIQRLRAINQSYDAAVLAVRDKCGSAVRRAGTGNI